MKVLENISLKNHNTFAVNVNAKYYVEINDEKSILELKDFIQTINSKILLLGHGSNILFTGDFDGIVLSIKIHGIKVIEENDDSALIEVGAGEKWDDFVSFAVNSNLGGIENLSLIPGTTGAAPIQNIGAYGQEVKDTIHSVKGIFLDTYEKQIFSNSECNFSYRNSLFKSILKNNFLITRVFFRLKKNPGITTSYGSIEKQLKDMGKNLNKLNISDLRESIIKIRESKLPDPAKLGNVGSFFKNPSISMEKFLQLKEKYPGIIGFEADDKTVKLSAGWLIENCGLKGFKAGNVGIYEKQALVIINYGEASGKEIFDFSKLVKEKILNKFDVLLQEEVNIH